MQNKEVKTVKRNVKRTLCAIMASALVASFAGCGSSGQSGSASAATGSADGEKTVIAMVHYMGEQTKRDALDLLIEAYQEKNPNVEFDVQTVSSEQYVTTYKTRIQANDALDLFFGKPQALTEFVNGGHFMDLTGEPLLDNLQDILVDECTIDGKVYGVPLDMQVKGAFYNKSMFEEMGVEVPTTRTEFLNVLETFNDAGILPLTHAYNFIHGPFHELDTIFTPMTVVNGAQSTWLDSQNNGVPLAGNETVKESLELFKILASYKDAGDASLDQTQAVQNFAAEQRPIYINGGWLMGDVATANPDTDFGVFPTPWSENPEENKLWAGIDDVFIVSSKTEIKDQVLDFLAFITSEEGAKIWMDTAKLMPGNTNVDVSEADAFVQEIKSYIDNDMIIAKAQVPDYTAEYSNAFRTKLQLFSTLDPSEMDVDQLISEIDTEISLISS